MTQKSAERDFPELDLGRGVPFFKIAGHKNSATMMVVLAHQDGPARFSDIRASFDARMGKSMPPATVNQLLRNFTSLHLAEQRQRLYSLTLFGRTIYSHFASLAQDMFDMLQEDRAKKIVNELLDLSAQSLTQAARSLPTEQQVHIAITMATFAHNLTQHSEE